MNISLITIGTELLNGKVKDLNTFTLSSLSRDYDFDLINAVAINDSKESILSTIDFLSVNSEVIIISGGLGPTKDDITKDVLIEKFGDSFEEIKNHNGAAKGILFNLQTKIVATPGVPSEFKMMLTKEIFQKLNIHSKESNQVIFKTHKIGESKIFSELCPTLWNDLEEYGEVSSLPQIGGVNIGVNLKDNSKKDKLINFVKSTKLNEIVWHIGNKSLEEVIIEKAKEKNIKIGFAESCTGGLLASKITDVSGSSFVFWGSIVSYSNEVKMRTLNVKEKTLHEHGAVSIETAKEMALGAKESMNLDIAITTTGIAGPNGGSKEKPVGTVCIGIATSEKVEAFRFELKGDRETLKEKFAKKALFLLLENLD